MENDFHEDDVNPSNPSKVRISITRASFSEDEGDESAEKSRPRTDSDSSIDDEEMERLMQEDEQNENEQLHNGGEKSTEHSSDPSSDDVGKDSGTAEDEEVSRAFENGVTINDEADGTASEQSESAGKVNDEGNESLQSSYNKEDSVESPPPKSPAMEMIGDRVLIERDGKFELVDVSEIKAEYYDMLGITPENNDKDNDNEGTNSETSENNAKEIEEEKPEPRPRPKTTSLHELQRRNAEKKKTARGIDRTRSQSAKAVRQRNDEFAHIKSEYAMTEQQLEIRRKCREAKLRRQKEEQEREREEEQRKREDADRAFQVSIFLF